MSITPPGWFPVAGSPGVLRWWDGTRWTEHFSQRVVAPPLAQPASSSIPAAGKVALVAAAAGLIGSFLPWVSVSVIFGGFDISGFEAGDGKLTAGAAIAALLFGFFGLTSRSRGLVVTAMLAAVAGLCVSGYDLLNVTDELSKQEGNIELVSVGYGLYICVAGFLTCIGCLIGVLSSTPTNK